jgi:hypothetical protein
MMEINKKAIDGKIKLKKVEYTHMEKSLIFGNRELA